VSQLFSQPNQYDSRLEHFGHRCVCLHDERLRTLFWEAGRLTCACGWMKAESTSSKETLKIAKMVVRTCTLTTSLIFLRCALVTKPKEVEMIRKQYNAATATLYHTAFLARNGNDMCNDSNYNWARCYFNRVAVQKLRLQLYELRHVWVAISQLIANSVADRIQCTKMRQLYLHAAARMSHHSLETEVSTYAGHWCNQCNDQFIQCTVVT
jgi:hypothetical protein